ncbi:MAG: D-2-hydroxyacid dehydrogenase [Clostridia bacterium]|nr:D-2-hydroxyacid dehydrogenase [Clostridia bacterium]
MKIVILDGYTLNPGDLSWDGLKALGDVVLYDRTSKEDVISRIGDAEIIFVNKVAITREILDSCPSIKYIGVFATGYNVVDVAAASDKNIPVCNVPTYGTTAVAQFVFAMLLEIAHHVFDHNLAVKRGDWTNSRDFCFWNYPLFELAGKTMGIIGYGRIGQATGALAQSFGMNVLAFDKFQNTGLVCDSMKYAELDELLEKSDVISLHCPLFPDTEGIINKDSIAKCKDGVIIINTSRGGLVVEKDMKAALESGKVSNFAADVVSTEPIEMGNPLLSAPNTLITPHIAWAPREARERLLKTAAANLKAWIDGKPQNVVN